jgi:hypothetical protein
MNYILWLEGKVTKQGREKIREVRLCKAPENRKLDARQ